MNFGKLGSRKMHSNIEKDVNLENVICDKNTIITAGHILKGAPNYPIVIEKGKVI